MCPPRALAVATWFGKNLVHSIWEFGLREIEIEIAENADMATVADEDADVGPPPPPVDDGDDDVGPALPPVKRRKVGWLSYCVHAVI